MKVSAQKLYEESLERLKTLREEGGEHLDEPIDLKNFTREQLRVLFEEGLDLKGYRADQVFEWMYRHLAESFDEMTNLSKDLRARLAGVFRLAPVDSKHQHVSDDGTTKYAFRCADDAVIESVLIPFQTHNALCISSQVGCAMGCTFCYTAKMGLVRHLSVAEIVDQVVQVRRRMEQRGESVTNLVFMGMGEPLHNVDNVIQACEILTDQNGLDFSRRRVTVSTSGLVPAMQRFMDESDCQLAVSLNATTDLTRSKIMPVNDRWDLETLMDAIRELPLERRQRVTLEYVLLAGVNDTLEDAERLVQLTDGVPCKVNLIPFNPHPETPFETPSEAAIDRFKQYLLDRHVSCFRRRTRGRDEMAACGQLGEPGQGREPRHLKKRLDNLRAAKT